MSGLTGIKDTDLKIIQELTDNELNKVCQVNKYVNPLCNEERFWLQRILIHFKMLNSQEVNKMKSFFGFSYKELYIFLKTFPVKQNFIEVRKNVEMTREEIISILKEENVINQIIDTSIKDPLPKWVNRQELVYDLRRNMPYFILKRRAYDPNPIYRYLQIAISMYTDNNFPRL